MLLIILILSSGIVINYYTDAEISVLECVTDWLVINRGFKADNESNGQDDLGRYILGVWPHFVLADENDQEDRRNFDELVAKCVGEDRVQMSEEGLRRMVNLRLILRENDGDYGYYEGTDSDDDHDHSFYVSKQLGYVLHTIKCVANYAALHYENAKTEMVKLRMIRVISDTLPVIVHSEMDGFEELKTCIERMEKPEESEKSLFGKMPILFGTKNENMDECINNEDKQNKEVTGSSVVLINCIDIHKITQNRQINRILQKHLIPIKKINDQIVAEMCCVGDFLVTKRMAKTFLELKFDEYGNPLVMRSVVKPKEPMGQDAEQLYQEQCAESIVRRNAMRKHGIGGMLNASYGTIYLERDLQHALDDLSMHLADYLVAKFMSSGVVDIVQLTARSDVYMANKMHSSLFRIQFHHENISQNYKVSEDTERDLYNYIKSMDDIKFKNWDQKTVAELIQMFNESQLFLSDQFINDYMEKNYDQERIMYSNLACIADFMIIYEGRTANFGENGKILPDGYRDLIRNDHIGEEEFMELAKCFGEDWVKNVDEVKLSGVQWVKNKHGKELLSAHRYFLQWGMDKFQVSEDLGRLLVNLRCVADYLVLNDGNVRLYSDPLYDLNIDEKTMPKSILRETENSEEFDKMVGCIKEPNKNYQILGRVVPPSLVQYNDEHLGNRIRIQLKEPNDPFMEKLLAHAYISEEVGEIIRAKFSCIVSVLVDQGNARTSADRDPMLRKVFRRVTIRKLPEHLLEETGCDQIFRNDEDDRKWKLEQRLNRNNNLYEMVAEEMIITNGELFRKLNQQSMCLADCLATHFWPKYVQEVDDPYLNFLAAKTGATQFRFKFPNETEIREKLERFLRNAETAEQFIQCVPKLAKTIDDQLMDTFMDHLKVFEPDQMFLSKGFDLFGCLADWLASKFGSKYIAEIDPTEYFMTYWLELSDYKFQFAKTEGFHLELKRILQNSKNKEEFKELTKCVPVLKLFREEIMVDQSGDLLYNLVKEHLENFGTKPICLSKKFDLTTLLSDYHHPTNEENDSENICGICRDEFGSEIGVKQLPGCKHLYHAECIKSWLKEHNRCPYCSATIFS